MKLEKIYKLIDEANGKDPHTEIDDGEVYPKELLYGKRMTECLESFDPAASEALKIAARGQHIERWTLPRENFPMDKVGYYNWRNTLKKYHADRLAELMKEIDYDEQTIQRVQQIVRKERLKQDKEAQTLEDVICLIFMKYYFKDFAEKHSQEKVIDIIQKTWKKMSDKGHEAALQLQLDSESARLVNLALAK